MLQILTAGLMAVIVLFSPMSVLADGEAQNSQPSVQESQPAETESSQIEESEKKPDRYSYRIILEERGVPIGVRIKYALDKDGDGVFDEPAIDLVSPTGETYAMRQNKTGFEGDIISSVIRRDKGKIDLILQSDVIGMWQVQTEYPVSLKTMDPAEMEESSESSAVEESRSGRDESDEESREAPEKNDESSEKPAQPSESSEQTDSENIESQVSGKNLLPLILAALGIAAMIGGLIALNKVTAKKYGTKSKKEKNDKLKQIKADKKSKTDDTDKVSDDTEDETAGSRAPVRSKDETGNKGSVNSKSAAEPVELSPEEKRRKEEEEAVRQMKEIYLNRQRYALPEKEQDKEVIKPAAKEPERPITREDVEKDSTIIKVTDGQDEETAEEKQPDAVKKSFFPDDRFGG